MLAVHSATLLLGRVRWGVGEEYMELGSAKVRLGWGLRRRVGGSYKGFGVEAKNVGEREEIEAC